MNGRIVSTSLPLCIIQMVRKNINPEDIEVIFSEDIFDSCLEAAEFYQDVFEYFTGDAVKCSYILGIMWDKVVQPRKYGWQFRPLTDCHWFPDYETMKDYYQFHMGMKIVRLYDILYAQVMARCEL